jgi:hypothetical protein
MRARDSLKCRERLAVEKFIRENKRTDVALEFSPDDVIKSSTYRLNRRGVAKALQNMAYVKAGVKKTGPSTYMVTVNTHVGWAPDAAAAMGHAVTSKIRPKNGRSIVRRKGPKRAAASAASLADRGTTSRQKARELTDVDRAIMVAAVELLRSGEEAGRLALRAIGECCEILQRRLAAWQE